MAGIKTVNVNRPFVKENITADEFDAMMSRGLKEANSKELYDLEKVFDELSRGI